MTRGIDAATLLELHAGVKVLSLDFFDTLVTRAVAQPSHVFAVMEERLIENDGVRWNGFAVQRVAAELRARHGVSQLDAMRDVTMSEIMVELSRGLGLSSTQCDELSEMEAATEIELVRPVGFGKELSDEARRRGVRLLIVSDNYMPSTHIAAMANAAGYEWVTSADVIVSCEHGGMKHNGLLWKVVLDRARVPAKRILHVGDDEIADRIQPGRVGIATHVNNAMRASHRHILNTTPAVLAMSRLEATQRDESAHGAWDTAQSLGDGVIAMVVAAQIKDVQSVLAQRRVSGVHFAARDGWMAHQVWGRLRQAGHQLPAASYISFSRSVIWRANLSSIDEAEAIRFIDQHETLTPLRLGRRFGCEMVCDVGPNELIDADAARDILLRNSAAVLASSLGLRERVIGYLRSCGLLDDGHHVVVDLGWTGSTIGDLSSLVERETRGRSTVEGRLVGLFWDAVPHRIKAPLHGFAMNDFGTLFDQIRLLGAVRLFESIITAPHGSVVDYQGAESGYAPIHADTATEQRAYGELVGRISQAAIESAFAILNGQHASGVSAVDVTGDAVWAAMMQVAHTPREDELDALASIRHVASVDHEGDGIPILAAAPRSSSTIPFERMGDVYDTIMKQHWLQGTVRQWSRDKSSEWFAEEICRRWPFMGAQWVEPPIL